MFVDSHAHLFFKDFHSDFDDVINRARDAGVRYIINPGTDIETSRESVALAEKYDLIYACVGFHPHDAAKANDHALEEIEVLSRHPKVVGIGEIGLDYHYNFSEPEQQQDIFARQIEIAQRRNLPIVIHSREAEHDTLRIVEEKMKRVPSWRTLPDGRPAPKGVFHCFPGDSAMAQMVIDWGFFISIPGPVTFGSKPNKPNSMVEVVSKIPIEHILLETDSPYLAPAPNRGKRNEPSNIPHIARKIAELQGRSVEEVGRVSSSGVKKLFGVGT
ncbi:MAG: TatD family hydrolase [Ignavibacteriae bacterium]|nr:TatD family hydrolase [Ignavibacteria bacterium]MBI3363549.1 TatD family hydrolase [Ignavibacteriota bacterium]